MQKPNVTKADFKLLAILAGIALFIGADWQTEIAWINLNNGWEFAWICQLWHITNWAALDFFRLIRYIIVIIFGSLSLKGVKG